MSKIIAELIGLADQVEDELRELLLQDGSDEYVRQQKGTLLGKRRALLEVINLVRPHVTYSITVHSIGKYGRRRNLIENGTFESGKLMSNGIKVPAYAYENWTELENGVWISYGSDRWDNWSVLIAMVKEQ